MNPSRPLCSLGKERMAMRMVEAIYKLKYFIFVNKKKHMDSGRSTGNFVLIGAWQPWSGSSFLPT